MEFFSCAISPDGSCIVEAADKKQMANAWCRGTRLYQPFSYADRNGHLLFTSFRCDSTVMKNAHVIVRDTNELLWILQNDGYFPIDTEKKLEDALRFVSTLSEKVNFNVRRLRRNFLRATKVLAFRNSIIAFFETLEKGHPKSDAAPARKKKRPKKVTSRKSPPVKVKARRTGPGLIASIIHRIKVTGANAEAGAVADFKRQYELKKKKIEMGIPLYSPGPAIDQENDEDPLHRK